MNAAVRFAGVLVPMALLVSGLAAQTQPTLSISVSLVDAARQAIPIARYALLISEDPPSASPRRVVTGSGGRVDVKLRPGRYIVESEEPAVGGGRAFEWTQMIEVKPGTDAVLVLDALNATTVSDAADVARSDAREDLRTTLLQRWQDSVVEIWTPTSHASGVVVDGSGLVATSARAVGKAGVVAVQMSPTLKVEAPVLTTTGDVSVVWVAPTRLTAATPLALECGATTLAPIGDAAKLFTVSAPMRSAKAVSVGFATSGAGATATDFRLPFGGAGGPVFDERGEAVGLTALAADPADDARPVVRVIGRDALCSARAAAEVASRAPGVAPGDTPLPVEPGLPIPVRVLEDARRTKTAWPQTLQMTTSDFEVSMLTPLLLFAERREFGAPGTADRTRSGRVPVGGTARPAPQRDFANWREYVEELPPVLMVRVTPRQVEGFWTRVARGAALTQGIALPPITHFTPGLSRLQLLCDGNGVTPIHPFALEQRLSDTEAVREGLFVFDPASLEACRAVTLALSSEKEPAKSETKPVDVANLQRLLDDIPQP